MPRKELVDSCYGCSHVAYCKIYGARVYTVKARGSSTCWKFSTSSCATKPQQGMSQARRKRQTRLPGQKCVKKTASTHLMSCTSTNLSFLLCSACRCLIIYIFQEYKILFVNKRHLLQNKVFNENYVHTVATTIRKMICFHNSKQSEKKKKMASAIRKQQTPWNWAAALWLRPHSDLTG